MHPKDKTLILGLFAVILVGSGFLLFNKKQGVTPQNYLDSSKKEEVDVTPLQTRMGKNSIVVYKQKPAETVKVAAVAIENPGFIVVHYATADNTPGEILGFSGLLQGYKENVEILLTQPSLDGDKYIAILHTDNGDGAFDATKDIQITDGIGNPLGMVFNISTDASGQPPKSAY